MCKLLAALVWPMGLAIKSTQFDGQKNVIAPFDLWINVNVRPHHAISTAFESQWSCASVDMVTVLIGQLPNEQVRIPELFGALPP